MYVRLLATIPTDHGLLHRNQVVSLPRQSAIDLINRRLAVPYPTTPETPTCKPEEQRHG
ncbi:MAG: hypothetical protein ABW115_22610 [Candidatus Thiodiazotropha sp. 6PLUC6]